MPGPNDPYSTYADALTSATAHEEITPSNDELDTLYKALYVGGVGTLVTEDKNGNTVSHENFSGYLMFRPYKVLPSTTCTNIIGYYD